MKNSGFKWDIHRRDFGKAAATLTAGLLWNDRAMASPSSVAVSGLEDGGIEGAARRAAEAVSDFSWLGRGDSVLIKPVVNSGNPYPATTSPLGLMAMVRLLKDKGAGRVVVSDMSGIEWVKLSEKGMERGSTRELMKNCGLLAAAESAAAEVWLPEEEGWDAWFEDELAKGKSWQGGVTMPKVVKEVDHIVLMPRVSRHLLAGSSLGMKAAVGYWRTDTRLEYHRDASTFQEKTAEANTARSLLDKQRLVVTVADQVLTTFGPDRGYVVKPERGLVLASQSVLAHDRTALAWLLINREAAPEDELNGLTKDPYQSQSAVATANRAVVMMLGGMGQAARAESLVRNDIGKVSDDRVIKRAAEIWGQDQITLVNAGGGLPSSLIENLEKRANS